MAYKIAVMGGGSWGTTVASLVSRNADIMLWARDAATVDDINGNHKNSRYLGDAPLNPTLEATLDPTEAIADADAVVMGIPSNNFRSVLTDIAPNLPDGAPLISLTKGLERGSRLRMTEICREVAPGRPVGVLTGPNLAREIVAGQAAAGVLALDDPSPQTWLQPVLNVGLFRVYTNPDHIGCELGGVFKNIIAIAVGMGDGLGAGDNTRAALITRGLAEMTRLGTALGGRAETFAGLAGMGDMIATCTSPQSRNRHVGIELAKGRSIEDIIASMHMVAEGVKSAPTVMELAAEHGIDMPISSDVYKVVTGASNARGVYRGLLRTRAAAESEPG
ncbi:NAD(P)H-dependent glycerol-3-phosphate dehydrogenase [Luminiphilus sp. nBUS_16]|uniref:NAD(P)H-dependent glycerol-3-phosphate dehydrogenase n=1 Tax=Luminiphilus sp. nBUS_16 TaxID=3395315 RepID=UPI003EC00330